MIIPIPIPVLLLIVMGLATLLLLRHVMRPYPANPTNQTEQSREVEPAYPQSLDKRDKDALNIYLNRFIETLTRELRQDIEVIRVELRVTIEIDILIGRGLNAVKREVLVPYHRVRDLTYWQQVGNIVMSDYRANHARPTPRLEERPATKPADSIAPRIQRLSKRDTPSGKAQ